MSLMNDLIQYIGLQQADAEQQNAGFSQLGQMLGAEAKRREDEKRRQENVKQQMSQAQQMMKTMSEMKDNSSTGKVTGTIDDDAQRRRKGVISVSDFTPSVEQGIGEDGMPYFKASIKSATPQKQPFTFDRPQKRTDTQNTASIFANRAEEAEGVFSKLDNYISKQGFDKFTAKIAPNFLKGADQQMYEQAQRNFVNAVLRKESGAVIADSEFKNAEIQYFPQPGDTPEVIKQKAANRRTQIEGLKVTAGKALDAGQRQNGQGVQGNNTSSVPSVGSTFNGEKVISVKRIR